ncbi:pro-sigmaK processing inhibitor BofA family protein [uncultured Tyzzerella sp.]|uniref:pro-sigmaK processing inhibitor BofA family protein n=1 Tax=uncultured Tyzzerella sp. TaxID=2321398 RepID=UPI002943C6F2|nr:pro-sigmaK processing inhibitor BofA family protein [uncultured Tyzzerella sp.]
MSSDNFIYIILGLLFITLLLSNKSLLKCLFSTLLSITIIFIANIMLKSTGVYVNINLFTGIFSGILGIPGIICLYILQILL